MRPAITFLNIQLSNSRENPARLIKVYDKKGSIADGKDADIVLLDAENDIADVFVGGNLIER